MPALKIQASNVPNAAVIQATATAVQNESKDTPGTSDKAICTTMACPKSVARATAIQPITALSSTSTGRTIMPTRPVAAAATRRGPQDV